MSKILFLGDDKQFASGVIENLRKQHAVDHFNYTSNEQLPAQSNYDLVVIDSATPPRELPALDHTRERKWQPPVLYLSQSDSPQTRVCGESDELTDKPCSAETLAARIKAILRREHPTEHIIQSGDIKLNLATRTMFIGRTEVELAEQEFLIFEFLVNHPESLFSPQDLLARVFGENAHAVDIHVCVENICKLFADSNRNCPIELDANHIVYSILPFRTGS